MINLPENTQLSFDTPFGLNGGLMALLVLVTLLALMIWRERRVLGSFWSTIFLCTRVLALVAIVWMVMQPMIVKESRHSKSQSVAILVDRSPSMDVVDSLTTPDMVGWMATQELDSSFARELSAIERSLMCSRQAIGMANAYRKWRLQPMRVEGSDRQFLELQQTLVRLGDLLKQTQDNAFENESILEMQGEVTSLLNGPVNAFLRQTRETDTKSINPSKNSVESMELDTVVAALERLTGQLSRIASLYRQDVLMERGSESYSTSTIGSTRRELIENYLTELEESLFAKLPASCRLVRYGFDESASGGSGNSGQSDWHDLLKLPGKTEDREEVSDLSVKTVSLTEQPEKNPDSEINTDISSALKALQSELRNQNVRFAVLLTEGRHNFVGSALPGDVAKELQGVPIYAVPIGNSTSRRDVILHRVSAPTTVVQGDQALIRAIVSAYDCLGETTSIKLLKNGEVINTQQFEFDGNDVDRRINFEVPTDQLGRSEYEIVVESVPEEATVKNNSVVVSVEVIKDKLRVLLADHYPRWEFRYLQQLFRRDEHIEHDEALFSPQISLTGDAFRMGGLPRSIEDWGRYDVVILGDLTVDQLTVEQQETLVKYVTERSGNVIFLAGQEYLPKVHGDLPLGRLLPVERSTRTLENGNSYALELTAEGELHPAMMISETTASSRQMWQEIYSRIPVTGMSDYHQLKVSARSLIVAKLMPAGQSSVDADQLSSLPHIGSFLSWQQVGKGHVVFLAAPATYQLRFRQGDKFHHRFWGQLLRWMTAAELAGGTEMVKIQTDKTRYAQGEDVSVMVRLTDPSGQPVRSGVVQVVARSQSEISQTLELTEDVQVPGLYRGVFEQPGAGVYSLEPAGETIVALEEQLTPNEKTATTLIAVETRLSTEMINTELNLPLLQQISEATGGQVISPLAISELFELTNFEPEIKSQIEMTPLWNRWPLLWLITGCLSLEWFVRKQKGLL